MVRILDECRSKIAATRSRQLERPTDIAMMSSRCNIHAQTGLSDIHLLSAGVRLTFISYLQVCGSL
jgi:hypothetical protein